MVPPKRKSKKFKYKLHQQVKQFLELYYDEENETLKEKYLEQFYKSLKLLAKKVVQKHYGKTPPSELEEVVNLWLHNFMVKVIGGHKERFGTDIERWASYIKAHIRSYLPFHRSKRDKRLIQEYNLDEVEDTTDFFSGVEAESLLESIFIKYFDGVRDYLPFAKREIKNVTHFMALHAVFSDVDVSAITIKRMGFYLSFLRSEFITLVQKELLDDEEG